MQMGNALNGVYRRMSEKLIENIPNAIIRQLKGGLQTNYSLFRFSVLWLS